MKNFMKRQREAAGGDAGAWASGRGDHTSAILMGNDEKWLAPLLRRRRCRGSAPSRFPSTTALSRPPEIEFCPHAVLAARALFLRKRNFLNIDYAGMFARDSRCESPARF